MDHKLDMTEVKDKPVRPNWWSARTAVLVTVLVIAVGVLVQDYLDREREAARVSLKLVQCTENLDCGEFGLCASKVCLVFVGEETIIDRATGRPQNLARYDLVLSASPPMQLCKDPPVGWVPPRPKRQVAAAQEVTQEDPCVVEVAEIDAFEFVIQPAGAEPTLDPELDCPTELNKPVEPVAPQPQNKASEVF